MRTFTIAMLHITMALLAGACAEKYEPPIVSGARPNILLIMADDMGFSDLGCYGSEIKTPHLDRLAKDGIRFTQFYNAARCCPTRAALLTGLYPHQAGVGMMTEDWGIPGYQGHLSDNSVTIAEVLKEAGYNTLMSGKWHVGDERPHWPVDRGFDRYFGLISGASNYFRLAPDRIMADDDQQYFPEDDTFYMTDLFTDHAVRFLEDYGPEEQPFFLYVGYTAPHYPLHALPDDIAKYRGRYRVGWDNLRMSRHAKMMKLGIVDANWPLAPRDPRDPGAWADVENKDEWTLKMEVYAAMIDRMDQGIGRILKKLREIGEEDNTLIMFLSDNGGYDGHRNRGVPGAPAGTADSYFTYDVHWGQLSNTPFRHYKQFTHEGGIATPFIARWPAGITRPGSLTHQVGHAIDVMATCLDVAGAEYPQTYNGHDITPLEGTSLAPVFLGERRDPHDALYWEHMGSRAVRQGHWKLVSDRRNDNWELYDMETDRTELHDLAGQHPDKVRELESLYNAWAQRANVLSKEEFRAYQQR